MNYTLEQVKQDIADGKVNKIYYSANTLWWTHLDEDVKNATVMGDALIEKRHKEMMADPKLPEDRKKRLSALKDIADQSVVSIPKDPTGSVLYEYTTESDIKNWIIAAEAKPEHFGKHGIDTFMMCHHRNCDQPSHKWDDYNKMIDEKKN